MVTTIPVRNVGRLEGMKDILKTEIKYESSVGYIIFFIAIILKLNLSVKKRRLVSFICIVQKILKNIKRDMSSQTLLNVELSLKKINVKFVTLNKNCKLIIETIQNLWKSCGFAEIVMPKFI